MMDTDPPYELRARIYSSIFMFDSRQWTREKPPEEPDYLTSMRDRILRDLNSRYARIHVLEVLPFIEQAKTMLNFAVPPEHWEILSSGPEEPQEELGEFPPDFETFPVPPEWGIPPPGSPDDDDDDEDDEEGEAGAGEAQVSE